MDYSVSKIQGYFLRCCYPGLLSQHTLAPSPDPPWRWCHTTQASEPGTPGHYTGQTRPEEHVIVLYVKERVEQNTAQSIQWKKRVPALFRRNIFIIIIHQTESFVLSPSQLTLRYKFCKLHYINWVQLYIIHFGRVKKRHIILYTSLFYLVLTRKKQVSSNSKSVSSSYSMDLNSIPSGKKSFLSVKSMSHSLYCFLSKFSVWDKVHLF